MSSFLRPLAYRHRWIYDLVTAVSSLSVGGVHRLRGLGLEALRPHLKPGATVLDLCCGSGEAAAPWLEAGFCVTGLDISPRALALAAQRHPAMTRVEGLAEDPPLEDASYAAIQLSVACMNSPDRTGKRCCAAVCDCCNPVAGWCWWTCIQLGPGYAGRSSCSAPCSKPIPPLPCWRMTSPPSSNGLVSLQ